MSVTNNCLHYSCMNARNCDFEPLHLQHVHLPGCPPSTETTHCCRSRRYSNAAPAAHFADIRAWRSISADLNSQSAGQNCHLSCCSQWPLLVYQGLFRRVWSVPLSFDFDRLKNVSGLAIQDCADFGECLKPDAFNLARLQKAQVLFCYANRMREFTGLHFAQCKHDIQPDHDFYVFHTNALFSDASSEA